jgi:thiamine-monophosphate kinase
MMDVSDGLLLDASRMAATSGLAVRIDLAAVPLSPAYRAWGGEALAAATAGDDYELLFALPDGVRPPVAATRIGAFAAGRWHDVAAGRRARPAPRAARLSARVPLSCLPAFPFRF